jgi:uncharacterized UPF0160 family protein
MKTVVTHNGKFHSDEIFGVAVLQLVYGIEHLEIIRTRDQIQIDKADIVLDVGGVYDPALQRFDHHQVGGPVRENGLPYAAFGLVWREYGENVTGSNEIADKIESDSHFRFVSFDIPELMRKNRDAFRRAIKKLGFKQIQKSLWVTTKEIGELVEMAAEEYSVADYIAYFVSESSNIDRHIEKMVENNKA